MEQVFDASPAWFCETDPHATTILERHWPGVPVLPDLKTAKWEEFVVPALRKDDLADEMYAAYVNGASLEEVGELFGRTRQSVWKMFDRRGLPLRQRPDPLPTVEFQGERYAIGVLGYYRKTRGDRSYLHRDVWAHYNGPIPDGYDVHHVDHDKTHNSLPNLGLLTKADHTRLHAADAAEEVVPPNSLAVDLVCAGYPLERANRSLMPADGKEPTTPGTCGLSSSQPFAFYDPGSSCWRTSQGTLDLDSTPSSVTLPKQGSMRSGVLYPLPPLAPATDATDCSCLPTPAANDSGNTPENHLRKKPGRTKITSLAVMARGGLLPTPRAQLGESRNNTAWQRPLDQPQNLENAIARIPSVAELLPTPTAWLGRRPSQSYGDPERWVNPERSNELSDFIAWIGATTSPQSDVGNTSSDDPRPHLPTNEDG